MERGNRFKNSAVYQENFVKLDTDSSNENFVDDVLKAQEKQEEQSSTPEPIEPPTTAPEPKPAPQIVEVMDKSKVGRPKLYEEESKLISVRLKMSNYEQARTIGGLYGGYTGYINYLIEQDIRNRKVNK